MVDKFDKEKYRLEWKKRIDALNELFDKILEEFKEETAIPISEKEQNKILREKYKKNKKDEESSNADFIAENVFETLKAFKFENETGLVCWVPKKAVKNVKGMKVWVEDWFK